MKTLFVFFCLLFLFKSFTASSQTESIRVTSERREDNSVDFSYEKDEPGSFFLKVDFTNLENAPRSDYSGVVSNYRGRLFSIKPLQNDRPLSYSYKYSWIRGVLNPKIDTSFVYLLPLSKNKKSKIMNLDNLSKLYFGNTEPKNWIAFQFHAEPGDTVFSVRKGLIVEVKDSFMPDATTSISYSTKENSIIVEHEDGSLAQYMVLKNGSIMVKPGETVLPHTPLAIAGTYDIEENTQVRLYIYYLNDDDLEKPENSSLATKKHYYSFINPIFHTKEGDTHVISRKEYTADFEEEHILRELNKRELKKLKK